MRKLDDVEKMVLEKDFEGAAYLLQDKGQKVLADLANTISEVFPYMDGDLDTKVMLDFLNLYKRGKSTPVKTRSFKSLSDAMKQFKIDIGYSNKEILLEEDRRRQKDNKRLNKEKSLLLPQTEFNPIIITKRIGLAKADVILVGNSKSIKHALEEFEYKHDIFSVNQIIIREVTLLGIRQDILYLPELHGKQKTKKLKYDDWKGAIKEKYKKRRYVISQIVKVLGRISFFDDRQVVINKVRRYQDHYYLMLLPRTVVSKPYCKERMGRLIPIITDWDMLVV